MTLKWSSPVGKMIGSLILTVFSDSFKSKFIIKFCKSHSFYKTYVFPCIELFWQKKIKTLLMYLSTINIKEFKEQTCQEFLLFSTRGNWVYLKFRKSLNFENFDCNKFIFWPHFEGMNHQKNIEFTIALYYCTYFSI